MTCILAATDLSTRSDRAVQRALRLSAKLKLPCRIVSVVDNDVPGDMLAGARTMTPNAPTPDLAGKRQPALPNPPKRAKLKPGVSLTRDESRGQRRFTTGSAGAFIVTGFAGAVLRFVIIFNSNWGKDELQTLCYAITPNCSKRADGGHSGARCATPPQQSRKWP